jgi:mannose-6-phosphate isomerase-like protein (cupin superfamily)
MLDSTGMMPKTVLKSAAAHPDSEGAWTDERCFIAEVWNHPSDPAVSLARARVPPGITTARHALAVEERYLIERGLGCVEIDGVETDVRPGDVVLIPRGARQRIRNLGEEDLVFLCVCTPRFEPACYEDREGS